MSTPFLDARTVVRRVLPAPVRRWVRAHLLPRPAPGEPFSASGPYEAPWEAIGAQFHEDESIGPGDFDLVGRIEFGLLLMEGLRPTDTLLDFGCGTGRLAVHAIPALAGGRYVGIDISQAMLDRARQRIARRSPVPPCEVSWVKLTTPAFPLEAGSVDMLCAFSVFTHMEHEDTYRYLKDALRIVRPGGRFVLSCLPMNLAFAQDIFLASAARDFRARWSNTRNVTTSVELMDAIARLAGWVPIRWYPGDARNIRAAGGVESYALGQSGCVLEAPRAAAS
jgi:SAM-dependent methyltransferase